MTKGELESVVDEVLEALPDDVHEALEDVTIYCLGTRADPELKDAIKNAGLKRAKIAQHFRGLWIGCLPEGFEEPDDHAQPLTATGSIVLNAAELVDGPDARDALLHEIGHALGMDEEEVENLGLG